MSYKRTPFKMAPKSPLTKALKGNQGKLPQHLQEAIKAAPESPVKQVSDFNHLGGPQGKDKEKVAKLKKKANKASAKGKYTKAAKLSGKAAGIERESRSPAKKGSCGKY